MPSKALELRSYKDVKGSDTSKFLRILFKADNPLLANSLGKGIRRETKDMINGTLASKIRCSTRYAGLLSCLVPYKCIC